MRTWGRVVVAALLVHNAAAFSIGLGQRLPVMRSVDRGGARRLPRMAAGPEEGGLFTLEDVEAAARAAGFTITMTNLGPLYRAMLRIGELSAGCARAGAQALALAH